jgi:hypothetical protein
MGHICRGQCEGPKMGSRMGPKSEISPGHLWLRNVCFSHEIRYIHGGSRSADDGNPRILACFLDESINAQLAACGKAAHRSVWHYRVHGNFAEAEKRRSAKVSIH